MALSGEGREDNQRAAQVSHQTRARVVRFKFDQMLPAHPPAPHSENRMAAVDAANASAHPHHTS